MGVNPMQRMKRNSTLLGIVVGLIVGLAICGTLYFLVLKDNTTLGSNKEDFKTVQVLNKTVKSGATITPSDVTTKNVEKSNTPNDAVIISSNVVAKIDLSAGTVLSSSMLNTDGLTVTKDLREQEYNMISLPSQLIVGDYIDIRLQLTNGGDYIVISKKQVKKCNNTTVWLYMNEEEIEVLSNAIIEYYIMAGSKLYATKYTDPGMQEASTPTYCPNSEVLYLISNNPNITSSITDGSGRYTDKLKNIRKEVFTSALNQYSDSALENIESNLQSEIEKLKQSRESYFGALDSAY